MHERSPYPSCSHALTNTTHNFCRQMERSMPSLKLLVVEDDIPSLELMTEIFTYLKAEVRPLSDSLQAAALVNQEKFDGIFLDLEMPKLDGLQLAQKVRESRWNKFTPVVIVTGHDQRDIMQQSFAMGATFFLQKPMDKHKLSSLFRTVRGPLCENRRRYLRVPLQTEVTCILGSRTITGRTWNLSQGGMQIETGRLQEDETLRLSFKLPGSAAPIDAFAVVAWVGENREGVHFTKMSAQHQEEIRQYIARSGLDY
jgi:CheY-like chemotaxis protein